VGIKFRSRKPEKVLLYEHIHIDSVEITSRRLKNLNKVPTYDWFIRYRLYAIDKNKPIYGKEKRARATNYSSDSLEVSIMDILRTKENFDLVKT